MMGYLSECQYLAPFGLYFSFLYLKKKKRKEKKTKTHRENQQCSNVKIIRRAAAQTGSGLWVAPSGPWTETDNLTTILSII